MGDERCPNCGYCPTCKRAAPVYTPPIYVSPYTPTYPTWPGTPHWTWTVGNTCGTTTTGGG